ncbi:MAG: outer membrane beta-barrel protein [Flavobacteriales bacterium]|jgi:outer membrane receptor protein involved in Fe transport
MWNFVLRILHWFVVSIALAGTVAAYGQGRPAGAGNPQEGRIYGKVLDQTSKKPLEFAVVRVLMRVPGDSINKVLTGALTAHNGDFSVDKVPFGKEVTLEVNLVGYTPYSRTLTLTRSGSIAEKDVGNILLSPAALLNTVEIVEEVSPFRIEFDKRIYEVDKNPVNEGGTAEDVLQNIPGVNVDVEGNVTVRNAPPQLFVDGRPTNLTIDQIPADAIQRVEVITNPSARYDASGGGGGILNIVLKKNRAMGYNGSVRAGLDSRLRSNAGLDFNVRQGKINVFGGFNYNQRRRISTGSTDRYNLGEQTSTRVFQTQRNINDGYFLRSNLGMDWFVDNRNTLTLNPSFTQGVFEPTDTIRVETDSLLSDVNPWYYSREANSYRVFRNISSSLLFKHLFADEGDELTADLSLSRITSEYDGTFINRYPGVSPSELKQTGDVSQYLAVVQVDYVNRLGEKMKTEAGVRASYRDYTSIYENFNRNINTGELEIIKQLNVNYHFLDQVYAAYGNLFLNRDKWQIQTGLRIESSDYRAELIDTTISFRNQYPLSLFPSAYITRVLNDKQDVQLSLNRRISRPNFHVLSPFTDYSDSLNISRGNPALRPEFTYSAELSYQYSYSKDHTFIAAFYSRYSTNLTVTQLFTEYSEVLGRDVVISTYKNASSSLAGGLELTGRNKFNEWFELTSNFNLFWSSVNGSNLEQGLTNSLTSYWFKLNATFKLPGAFIFQASGDYTSKRLLETGSTSRAGIGGGEGGGPWNMALNTVQGYVEPAYGFDFSLRRDFLKEKRLSATISIRDAFRTRVNVVYSESPFFTQETFRRRDPQLVRFNLTWRFGKADSQLFRRKNMRQGGESMDG